MDKFFGLDNPAKVDKDTALLTTTHDDVEKNIICGILEEEKIPFLAKDRRAPRLFGRSILVQCV